MADRQGLTIRKAADRGQALALIQRAEAHATDGATAEDMAEGCALFLIEQGGQPVGAFALRIDTFGGGRHVLTVTGAGGQGDNGQAEAMAEFCEQQGQRIGAQLLTCTTRRRGLVRKLERQGYKVAGYVMTKTIERAPHGIAQQ